MDRDARRTSRASSPARSGRPTARRRSRRTSTIPAARNVTFDELVAAYTEAIEGLVDGGVDLLLVETVFDTLNAKAALFAIDELFERSGRRPAGDGLRHDHRRVRAHALGADDRGVLELGAPRAAARRRASTARSAPAQMRPYIEELSRVADTYVCCYPNAGLPNEFGDYDETPEMTAAHCSRDFAREAASSTSSAAAAARRRRTSRRSPRRCAAGDAVPAAADPANPTCCITRRAAPLRPRAASRRRRLAVRQHRRAHQRHRLRRSSPS